MQSPNDLELRGVNLAGLVDSTIGNAYLIVRAVYEKLDAILEINDGIANINLVSDALVNIQSILDNLDTIQSTVTNIDSILEVNSNITNIDILANAIADIQALVPEIALIQQLALAFDNIPENSVVNSVLAQVSGNSTTAVMSQKAVTDLILGGITIPMITHNLSAVTNPTISDDASAGYQVQSVWKNTSTGDRYVCLADTVGAAYWVKLESIAATNVIYNNATSGRASNTAQAVIDEISGVVANLNQLSGVNLTATDLGDFSGTTIPSNVKIKPALQSLELAQEANANSISLVQSGIPNIRLNPTVSGTATQIVATLPGTVTLVDGLTIIIKSIYNVSSNTARLNLNGTGLKYIFTNDADYTIPYSILTGGIYTLVYSLTKDAWILLNPDRKTVLLFGGETDYVGNTSVVFTHNLPGLGLDLMSASMKIVATCIADGGDAGYPKFNSILLPVGTDGTSGCTLQFENTEAILHIASGGIKVVRGSSPRNTVALGNSKWVLTLTILL